MTLSNLSKGQVRLDSYKPPMMNHRWLCTNPESPTSHKYGCFLTSSSLLIKEMHRSLPRLWTLEELPERKLLITDEKTFVKALSDSIFHNSKDRYEVNLSVISEKLVHLGHSRDYGMRCFLSLEKRFQHDPMYHKEYKDFINGYVGLSNAHFIDDDDESNTPFQYVMPHHAVIKAFSSTTKLRVVFNASARSNTGLSLNDALPAGPVLQPELFDILLRFRTYKYVFTTDIQNMH